MLLYYDENVKKIRFSLKGKSIKLSYAFLIMLSFVFSLNQYISSLKMIKTNLISVQTTFENSKTYRTSARTKWPPICCSKKEVVEGWCWWGEWRCWPTWRRSSCECSSKDKCPRNDFPETNFVILFYFSLNDIFNFFFIKFALNTIV